MKIKKPHAVIATDNVSFIHTALNHHNNSISDHEQIIILLLC